MTLNTFISVFVLGTLQTLQLRVNILVLMLVWSSSFPQIVPPFKQKYMVHFNIGGVMEPQLSCFISGGKPTNGGSASWSPGSWDRTAPVHRRPVVQGFKREVKNQSLLFPFPPFIFTDPFLISVNYIFTHRGAPGAGPLGSRGLCGGLERRPLHLKHTSNSLSCKTRHNW